LVLALVRVQELVRVRVQGQKQGQVLVLVVEQLNQELPYLVQAQALEQALEE
jgi:hypothetical protein